MRTYEFAAGFTATPQTERWEEILARAYAAKIRPKCLCKPREDAPKMYIAAVRGAHVLKRMPFSGARHAPHCDHYEAPPELSGLGQVSGSAIREDPDSDTTTLNLDFALTKGAARAQPAGGATEHDSVRSDGTKLTLRATLHYLYDEAGLTRWSPRMRGRRSWAVVRRELLQAAGNKLAKGKSLTDLLFIPDAYSAEHAAEIAAERARKLARLAECPGSRMLLIAPVKHIDQARFGHKIVLKHLPDMPLMVNDDLHKRLTVRFAVQLALWGQLDSTMLLLIGTFSQPVSGLYALEAGCLVNVNGGWIPFETAHEYQLLEGLAERRYSKGLRYNLPSTKPLASAVLYDSEQPTALYIVEADASDEQRAAAEQLATGSGLASWWWDVRKDLMPALPAEVRATPARHDEAQAVGPTFAAPDGAYQPG